MSIVVQRIFLKVIYNKYSRMSTVFVDVECSNSNPCVSCHDRCHQRMARLSPTRVDIPIVQLPCVRRRVSALCGYSLQFHCIMFIHSFRSGQRDPSSACCISISSHAISGCYRRSRRLSIRSRCMDTMKQFCIEHDRLIEADRLIGLVDRG